MKIRLRPLAKAGLIVGAVALVVAAITATAAVGFGVHSPAGVYWATFGALLCIVLCLMSSTGTAGE